MAEPVIFGAHEAQTLAQLRDVASRAERVALMADGHLGYVMPIGGVAAYRRQVSVVGVGFDIACGNAAIRTNRRAQDFARAELEALADEIQHVISFGMGRTNRADDAPTDHPLFADPAWSAVPGKHENGLKAKARSQLGTVGGGNHYVDVFADETGDLWVGVHFGSRGLGHTVASGFLALSQGKRWGERVPEREALLSLDQPLGHDYWQLMTLAGAYAYAGREWVARKVVSILGG
jgi:tRNA-splicing ligase RtcB